MTAGGPFPSIEAQITFLKFAGLNEAEIRKELLRRVRQGNVVFEFEDKSMQGVRSGLNRREATPNEIRRLRRQVRDRFPNG